MPHTFKDNNESTTAAKDCRIQFTVTWQLTAVDAAVRLLIYWRSYNTFQGIKSSLLFILYLPTSFFLLSQSYVPFLPPMFHFSSRLFLPFPIYNSPHLFFSSRHYVATFLMVSIYYCRRIFALKRHQCAFQRSLFLLTPNGMTVGGIIENKGSIHSFSLISNPFNRVMKPCPLQ